jgi:DNA replication protein DnaC
VLRRVEQDEGAPCQFGECDGSTWILDEETNEARPCRCREARVNAGISGRLRGGIPRRMRAASLDRHPFLDSAVVRHVNTFMRKIDDRLRSGDGMWLHGDIGTGKTTIALLIAGAAQEAGRSVAIYSTPLLLAELRATYDADSTDSFMQLFRRLTTVDLLVLDDLGAERETEWVLEQLFSLVNERWQDERSIVVTSNSPDPSQDATIGTLRGVIERLEAESKREARADTLAPLVDRLEIAARRLAELELISDADPLAWMRERIGSRTVSRLYQMCDDPIVLSGSDLRMRVAGA